MNFDDKNLFYEDILRELYENKIRYILVGGLAVSLHGAVRFTADVDIILSLDNENVKDFISMMNKLGYKPKVPVDPVDFTNPQKRKEWIDNKNMKVFSFYNPEKPIEIVDVFVDNPIDFENMYNRKVVKKAKNIEIPIASIDDLIELKKISGRDQDKLDINKLQELKKLL